MMCSVLLYLNLLTVNICGLYIRLPLNFTIQTYMPCFPARWIEVSGDELLHCPNEGLQCEGYSHIRFGMKYSETL